MLLVGSHPRRVWMFDPLWPVAQGGVCSPPRKRRPTTIPSPLSRPVFLFGHTLHPRLRAPHPDHLSPPPLQLLLPAVSLRVLFPLCELQAGAVLVHPGAAAAVAGALATVVVGAGALVVGAAAVAGVASATVVAGAAAHEAGVVLGAVAVVAPVAGAGVARAWRAAPRW
jgi:hypothetical protein